MKPARVWVVLIIVLAGSVSSLAQMPPNLENGFKHWGSYDGGSLDTVNNLNGNQMLHAPLLPNYPQRGGTLTMQSFLYQTSKSWQVFCSVDLNNEVTCQWGLGRPGVNLRQSEALTIQRTMHQYGSGTGQGSFRAYGYTIQDAAGATHQMIGSGSVDSTGEFTRFDSIDTSGYHLEMSNPDNNGVMNTATVTDRHGSQYVVSIWSGGTDTGPTLCPQLPANHLAPARLGGGLVEPIIDDAPMGQQDCSQAAFAEQVTDSNGNRIVSPNGASTDTLGRAFAFFNGGLATTDYSGCASNHTISAATLQSYTAPDGATRQMKLCYGNIPISTAFNVSGIVESTGYSSPQLVNVVLADGTKWTFDYDSYGEVTSIGLPIGGSIAYTWTTIVFPSCAVPDGGVSRAVASRTVNDNNGHSYTWNYSWGVVVNSVISNTVTDPLNNDTVHVLTALDGTGAGNCGFFETRTQFYQGTGGSRSLLKQVDTTYTKTFFNTETPVGSGMGSVVPASIQTTIYPSGKVSLVQKTYAPPTFAGGPISGNVATEKDYDWGQGAPGALLKEIDTTYQWQQNSSYAAANMLDLPASVIVKDGGGNRVAETDYVYDEPAYLTAANVTTQHFSPPNSVRGNLTTVSQWLNTTNSFISSHTRWYDTGEPFQKIDPLGHTTTLSYDSAYAGAYVTQTCSPQTGSVAHCVSGTYDFNTGVLTSLTNENATTQASGNTPGDTAHTSNYVTDFQWRITSAQAPPDPANASARAQTTLTYSTPNTYPLNIQQQRSITNSLTDTATAYFDGLARSYQGQHSTPSGTVTVNTTFDALGHPTSISNPFYSTSDSTYGITQSQYDVLGRATRTTKQDGSITRVKYSAFTTVSVNADCTQTTDEAGKQRGACTDALGRLVEVDEPVINGAPIQANFHATMQTDGNFVLYSSTNNALWATNTSNGVTILMQDDGNLVLYHELWERGTYRVPSGVTSPYDSCRVGSTLSAGQALHENECLESPNGMTYAVMVNGDLQMYDRQLAQLTWTSGTYGHPGAYALMQSDGNFVIYDAANNYLWASWTFGASLVEMENDGRLIIYNAVWSSGTMQPPVTGSLTHPGCDVGSGTGWTGVLNSGQCFVSRNGHFELLMQADGNLVIYDLSVTPNAALWSTDTAVSTADPGSAMRTLYTYDTLGNLTCVEQHGTATTGTGCSAAPSNDATSPWRVRRFTYDSLSRLLTAKNPESGTITYLYDNDGQLLAKTSPAPNQTGSATQTVSFCYDELHRPTKRDYSVHTYAPPACPITTPIVSYVYDSGANAKGHLTSLTDQPGTATYAYDILGRLTTETRTLTGANNAAISKTISYSYNLDGSVKTLTYPSGKVITYTPDSAGRVLSAVDSGSAINYVTGATYGPDSALTGFISGNSGTFAGITNAFSYNKRLQPVNMSATAPSQTVFSIGYDFHVGNGTTGADNGNVWGITNYKDNTRNQTFTYDELNRLTSAQNAGSDCNATVLGGKKKFWGNSYGYDAWGNLLSKTVTKCSSESLSVVAGTNNRLTGAYLYDAAGNMTHDATSGLNYTFDQENRLTGANGYTYTYDGAGNRVRKSNGNLAANGTLYWSMTPGVVAETDLAGAIKSEYIFFDGERVARRDGPTGAGGVFYYFSDHLKTASVITDSAGVIKAESDYYPWGGELQFVNNDSNDYKFTGKKRDTETGLDYFGARYYSNGLGRFVTPDWSAVPVPVPYADLGDPQSLNQYSYVRNIPTFKVDPDGHQCPTCPVTVPAPNPTAAEVDQALESVQRGTQAAEEGEAVAAGEAAGGRLLGPLVGGLIFVGEMIFPESVDSGETPKPGFVPRVAPKPGQIDQTEHIPDPAPASGGARKGGGRGGKQDRLKELGKDDKVSSADRGEIKRDQNQIARGTRSNIRVPGNKHLAHRRGHEARKGHDYKHSDLQSPDLHKLQHKHEGYK